MKYIFIEPGKLEFIGKKKYNFWKEYNNKLIFNKKSFFIYHWRKKFSYSKNSYSSIINYAVFSENYLLVTINLESLLIKIGLKNKNIKLLKLEAEGAETEVIKGSFKNLEI